MMIAHMVSGKMLDTNKYEGISPPPNSMVKMMYTMMPLRPTRYFLETG